MDPTRKQATVTPVACCVEDILSCYDNLSKLANLKPSPDTNRILGKLVALCISISDELVATTVLLDARIQTISPHLLQLCSEAEYQLELDWSRRICCSENSADGQ